jgi:hypothetical protein
MSKQIVALVGAGGKMGRRLTDNLKDHPDYDMRYLEVSPDGIEALRAKGVEVASPQQAIAIADMVIFAVPDTALGKVTAQYVPRMKSGALAVCLDPAAAHAGHLARRAGIPYFVSHPCHPSLFNYEPDERAHFDYFGGISARQPIVSAIINGDEKDYARGEALARAMYAPVNRAHRITIEQMALLEPALAETMAAAMLQAMREGLDEVVRRGVPKEAARDFMLGHMNILAAVIFEEIEGRFSDACNKAMEIGRPIIFKEDWKKIFEPESVMEQVKAIT